jgi:hypothetical protein
MNKCPDSIDEYQVKTGNIVLVGLAPLMYSYSGQLQVGNSETIGWTYYGSLD